MKQKPPPGPPNLTLVAGGPAPLAPGAVYRRGECKKGSEVELAERLIAVLREGRGDDEVVWDEGDFYRYVSDDGVWERVSYEELSCVVQSFDGAPVLGQKKPLKVGAGFVAGVVQLARAKLARDNDGFFRTPVSGLAFRNGFVRVDAAGGIILETHAASNRARIRYEFDYVSGVSPVMFLSFLGEIFRDDEDRADREKFIQEFFGGALLGISTKYNKSAFLKSGGGGGRSTLGKIMQSAMPLNSVSHVKPQQFEDDNYRMMLHQKLLNFVDECPKTSLLDTSWFKQIVTGDKTVACAKYKTPVTFYPRAGHCFLVQELPPTGDLTPAFFARIIVLSFRRNFREEAGHDPHLADKIIAGELPAIAAWLLEGGLRLLRQGRYTIPASHAAALMGWRTDSDSVAAFLTETRVLATGHYPTLAEGKPTDWQPCHVVYGAYVVWCNETGHKAVAHNTFGTRMASYGLGSVSNGKLRYYRVKRKTDADGDRADALSEIMSLSKR